MEWRRSGCWAHRKSILSDHYGEKHYADLQHAECLEGMRQSKLPADPQTIARYFQALAWRLDQLEAKLDELRTLK